MPNQAMPLGKLKDYADGKDQYLLGTDSNGVRYWLESATWDCSWYWGFGYVETYRGNRMPSKAKDIDSHQHIKNSFIGNTHGKYVHNIFDSPLLAHTTFTEEEGWVLSELFFSFYKLKEAAEFYHTGGAGITINPLRELMVNKQQEDHINKVLLPPIFQEIYKILAPVE
jgi:hypothetical protein